MAADLGLNERVEFPGRVGPEKMTDYLRTADVMVLPSHNEGLPMSVLEGMGHGLAILTTPVGAITEAITDGETGLIVPGGKTNNLAAAIEHLVSDRGLRARLGENAEERFRRDFDIDVYARRILNIYDDV